MRNEFIALIGVAFTALTVSANAAGHNVVIADVNDPVSLRINVMQNVGGAAAIAGGMLKGEIPFDSQVALGALKTINTAALGIQGLFPEGSDDNPRSTTAASIWSDPAGFNATIAKFIADSTANSKTAPADLAQLGASFGAVASNCKACHQTYRIKN